MWKGKAATFIAAGVAPGRDRPTKKYDLDSIISELRFCAPDLYQLFMTLGDTQRHQEEEEVTTENVKAVSALCSTLNAQSARSKGLQLLLGMMLIARQVSIKSERETKGGGGGRNKIGDR